MKPASTFAAAGPRARSETLDPWTFSIKRLWRAWLARAWRDAMEAWALVERLRRPWGWM